MSEVEQFRPFAAAYLVLIKDQKVLLSRRCNTRYMNGFYSLVAGHLEGSETTKECIIREAKEEAGIDLDVEHTRVVHCMHRFAVDREYFDVYLECTSWRGEPNIQEPDKCDDLSWFDLNNLPENLLPEVRYALEAIANNVPFSDVGWEARK